MKQPVYTLIVLLFLSFAFSFKSTDTQIMRTSNRNESGCRSIDAVVLLDQSGSMESLNDKEGFRVTAAQDILLRFGLNAIFDCPEAYHRVAIINFGDNAQPVQFFKDSANVPWLQIGGYGYNVDITDWENRFSAYVNLISPEHIGETNTLAAVQTSKDLLAQMSASPLGKLPTTQAIILITDGKPYPDENSQMRKIRQELNAMPNAKFWVVALNQGEKPYLDSPLLPDVCIKAQSRCTIGAFWTDLSEEHGGELRPLSQNRNEIPQVLNEVYDKLFGIGGLIPVCGEPFYVDPYTQSATFTISKNNPDVQVFLENETKSLEFRGGRVYQAGQVLEDFAVTKGLTKTDGSLPLIRYWAQSGREERYILAQPEPGRWRVNSSKCPEVRVRYSPLSVSAYMLSPELPLAVIRDKPYFDETDMAFFKIGVEDSAGNPVANNKDYPLTISLTYTDEEGNLINPPNSTSSEWILDPSENGIWQAREGQPVLVPKAETYKVTIKGTAPSANPEQSVLTIFEKSDFSFTVLDVSSFKFAIVQPEKKNPPENIPLNKYESLTQQSNALVQVDVQFFVKGKKISPEGILLGDSPFRAVLSGQDGKALEEIDMQPANDNGLYRGFFRTQSKNIDSEGEYIIDVGLITGGWDANHWQPSNLSDKVTIQRKRVPLLEWIVQDSAIRKYAEVTGGTILIVLIGWIIWCMTGPLAGNITLSKRQGVRWEELGSYNFRSSICRRKSVHSLHSWDRQLGRCKAEPIMEIDESTRRTRRVLSGINIVVKDARGRILTSNILGKGEVDEFEIQDGQGGAEEFKIAYSV